MACFATFLWIPTDKAAEIAEGVIVPEEDTIADMLKRRDYACGVFGKWHLGDHQPYLPLQQGFDEYFGLPYSNDMWPVDFDGTPIQPGQKRGEWNGKPHRPYYPPLFLMHNDIARLRGL